MKRHRTDDTIRDRIQSVFATADPTNDAREHLPVTSGCIEKSTLVNLSDRFWFEGWGALRGFLPLPLCNRLRSLVTALIADGIPPAYVFASPIAWQVIAHLDPLARHFLGDRWRLLPHVWAWHVVPDGRDTGWPPHRDYQGESVIGDSLLSLSVWIPLSPATPENGCMALLPKTREVQYPRQPVEAADVRLQDVLVLPAAPGDVLFWRQDVLHWGGRSSPFATEPRISLAVELQNPSFSPLADPLLDPRTPPGPDERFALIERQFAKYHHMESARGAETRSEPDEPG